MKDRNTLRRLTCAALCALLTCLCAMALGEARMPADRGVVTDDANVLGAQTAADIAAYADELDDETNVRLHVAIVDFLDGMDAQSYADALFERWDLDDDDFLLLGAAGEDSFAVAMGEDVKEKLGDTSVKNLLYKASSFSEHFVAQRYDAAFASYFVAFNTLIEKQYDERISLGALFESAQQSATATPKPDAGESASQSWKDFIASLKTSGDDYQEVHETRRRESNGIGVGGWVILAIIIAIIFGQSDPVRKARRQSSRDYRRYGCGCSPLGWVLNLIGVGVIIDNLRKK